METVIIALYADLRMGWGREGMKRIPTTAKCVFFFLFENSTYELRSLHRAGIFGRVTETKVDF